MDMGLERLSNAIGDMGNLAQDSVMKAIQAYARGERITQEAMNRAHQLSLVANEVEEIAMELLVRYQPVATDLRFIKSCLEIAYGFQRFGRYALDIAQVLEIFGDLSQCDKAGVEEMSSMVAQMINQSIQSFKSRDTKIARSMRHEDDQVDRMYLDQIRHISKGNVEVKCALASTLVMRYLERIADHACYIGDSVTYIVTGSKL
jgi:phosphate transport system protein